VQKASLLQKFGKSAYVVIALNLSVVEYVDYKF